MKLKDGFVTQDINGTQFLVAVGGDAFGGIVRSNKTAAFIVDLLKEDTDRKRILDAMCARYNAPRERIAADLEEILETLRGIGALEEP